MIRNSTRGQILLLIFLTGAALPRSAQAGPDRPNVLFIISDDLNTALSGMGHPECRTPHLDQLVQSGVSFTHVFCQFPLCGPSRASIMTGQYPLVNQVTGNGGEVNPDRITLPRHFANHGYWTARVSKIYHMAIPADIMEGNPGRDHPASWHEAHNITALEALTPGSAEDFLDSSVVATFPQERQKWYDAQASGEQYRMSKVARAQFAVIEVPEANQHLLADTMAADKAIQLLQTRADKAEPFFLAVGLVRPHFPFIATEETIGQYHTDDVSVPHVPEDDLQDVPSQAIDSVMDFDTTPLRKLRRGYYGAVSFMDRQVGRILAELDRLQLRDNTIVVFASDHGYLLGEHRMWKKSKLWEEAIRVPLIISVPGETQAKTCDHFVELVDLYPTLTELAGLPAEPGAQGQSLTPLLDDPDLTLPRTDAFIQVGDGFGLRSGQWAYMWYPASRKHQNEGSMLYDMDADPQQYINLADDVAYSSLKTRLHKRLMQRVAAAEN